MSNNIHINPNFINHMNGERQYIHINPLFVKGVNKLQNERSLNIHTPTADIGMSYSLATLPVDNKQANFSTAEYVKPFHERSFTSCGKSGLPLKISKLLESKSKPIISSSSSGQCSIAVSPLQRDFRYKSYAESKDQKKYMPGSFYDNYNDTYRKNFQSRYKINRKEELLQHNCSNKTYNKVKKLEHSESLLVHSNNHSNKDSYKILTDVIADKISQSNLHAKSRPFIESVIAKQSHVSVEPQKYVKSDGKKVTNKASANKKNVSAIIKQSDALESQQIKKYGVSLTNGMTGSISNSTGQIQNNRSKDHNVNAEEAVYNSVNCQKISSPSRVNSTESKSVNSFLFRCQKSDMTVTAGSTNPVAISGLMNSKLPNPLLENKSRYKLVRHPEKDNNTAKVIYSPRNPKFSKSSNFEKLKAKCIQHGYCNGVKLHYVNKNNTRFSYNTQRVKSFPKPLKRGVLIKAYQNMIFKKFLYKKLYGSCSYDYYKSNVPAYSKFKLVNNKTPKDVVSKYKINRKRISSKVSNKDACSVMKLNNSKPMPERGCPHIVKTEDIISKYKIKRVNKNGRKPNEQQTANKGLVSKYKINRKVNSRPQYLCKGHNRTSSLKKKRSNKMSDKFINIGGHMYKSTRMSLNKQDLLKKKRTQGREEDSSKCHTQTKSLVKSNTKYKINRRVFIESQHASKPGMLLEIVRRKKLGLLLKKRNDLCLFYHRYGKCKKRDEGECPFIHDPDKIAVCTRFLHGSCKLSSCPFSHQLDKSKMPVCSHFLNGSCNKDECPYRHVNVNPKAPVCRNFLKGYCPHGEKCKKKHILICEEFQSSGKCSLGVSCPLSHRKMKKEVKKTWRKRRKRSSSSCSIAGASRLKHRLNSKLGVLGGEVPSIAIGSRIKKKKGSSSNRYFEQSCAKNRDDYIANKCTGVMSDEIVPLEQRSDSSTLCDHKNDRNALFDKRNNTVLFGQRDDADATYVQKGDTGNHFQQREDKIITTEQIYDRYDRLGQKDDASGQGSDISPVEQREKSNFPSKQRTGESLLNQATFSEIFEHKRERLMKKVEKFKSTYTIGLDEGLCSPANQSSHQNSNVDLEMSVQSDAELVLWRVPLPDVLPSYIPLTMPKEDEKR